MKRPRLAASITILASLALVFAPVGSAAFQTREEALAALQQYNRLIESAPGVAVFYTQRGDAYYALNDLYAAMES